MQDKEIIRDNAPESNCTDGCGCSCSHEAAEHDQHLRNETETTYQQAVFMIAGLDCGDCAEKLRKRVAALDGVQRVRINFGAAKLYVTHTVSRAVIVKCIETAGYKVIDAYREHFAQRREWWRNPKNIVTIISGILLLLAAACSWLGMPDYLVSAIYAAAILTGCYYVVRAAWASIYSFTPDMNALMSIAVLGAIAIGEWSEGATVVFLFSLGNALQAYTMDKTREAISSLMSLAPSTALVKRGCSEEILDVENIDIGDIIIVKPGERIAMDGIVSKGISAVDQAAITGESIPVEKQEGDAVYAGTINRQGALEVVVTKLVKDSTLVKIMHLVEEAQAQRAPAQQFIDVFARYYTPAVILGAVGMVLIPWLWLQQPFTEWFYRALVLLVIACPCALVISTPVSIVAAIGSASRQGILIKGGVHLETIGAVKSLAFDKTGTLTYGRPEVVAVTALHNFTETELLSIAASLEKRSEHSLAQAICVKAQGLPLYTVEQFHAHPGKGAQGKINSQLYYIGNRRLFQELGLDLIPYEQSQDELARTGKSIVLVGTAHMLYGWITVADTVREASPSAVESLRSKGIGAIVMLTGDNRPVADSVAQQVRIREVYGDLLPEDKVSVVQEMQRKYGSVAMVGDGVNDAPALAAANVGIVMGVAGSDSALETADIALMNDDIGKLAYIVELGRSMMAIIRQNIIFSLFIKLGFIALTIYGLSNLWMAVFADTGAALLVTLNSMRLARK
jgi:Cd2+/Zn2+-exporting ATPase